jgi:hypothetical protein
MIGQTMVSNAKGYDWANWAIGIFRALIGGGAGGVAGAFGSALTDPEHFNFGGGLHHILTLMGVNFVIVGLVNMCIFLQTHGAPDKLQSSLKTAADATAKAGAAISDAQSQAPTKP